MISATNRESAAIFTECLQLRRHVVILRDCIPQRLDEGRRLDLKGVPDLRPDLCAQTPISYLRFDLGL